MEWLHRFAQLVTDGATSFSLWVATLFMWILRIIAFIIAAFIVIFIIRLLVEWHADFLYDYFIRRLYEDFFSSGQTPETTLNLMQMLSQ